ncbi:hypothetical protein ACOBQJ_04935 [Pelotomaculum propionicicum]|uniref:hypothetical protein n=1 Tax=Pelotomaculum propionicicum TaxID=258475 RepID=UPI003B7E4FA0
MKKILILFLVCLVSYLAAGCSVISDESKQRLRDQAKQPTASDVQQPGQKPAGSEPEQASKNNELQSVIQEKEIDMDMDTRKKLNTFFSNFSEVSLAPFERGKISQSELIRFGIYHNWLNNYNLFTIEGSKAYIDEAAVYSSIKKYFGLDVDKPVNEFSYSNGMYQITAATGEAYRFSQIAKLVDKGNGYYEADVNVYEASSGFTGNPHGSLDEWKREAEGPYDIPEVIGMMKATIKKAEDGRYILVDYLP